MDTVDEFAASLFSKDPGAPGSVDLAVETEDTSGLFEVLLLIVTYGMKRWYGPRIDITQISTDHLKRLQEYFLSFDIHFTIDKIPEPDTYMIDNKAYVGKTRLEDMTFTVAANRYLWILHFAYARA